MQNKYIKLSIIYSNYDFDKILTSLFIDHNKLKISLIR